MSYFVVCFLLVVLVTSSFALPLWKVFCTQEPLFRGRADPIVNPGVLSQHSHKVWGGNNFGLGETPVDSLAYYNHLRASACTTCSIELDLSAYWISDLYYRWPNGSLSLVPHGGLTIYYPSRGGYGNQTHPDLQPFPPGLRMTSGSPWRRSFNPNIMSNRAISYNCLGGNIPEVPYFPTNGTQCPDGLRAQVWFPMCWDGVHLDSADHQSHMSFPIQAPDGGDCPSTHPVRLPGIFFEVLFDVNPDVFPHGEGENPFVWSCGDSTGYGLHGDFINGWDTDLVRAALKDPMCDLSLNPNLAFGNNVTACPPMAPYVKKSNPGGKCQLSSKINTIEDLGVSHLVDALPGCNPITGYSTTPVTPCNTPQPAPSLFNGVRRVLLKSAANGKYVTANNASVPVTASVATDNPNVLNYAQVFLLLPQGTNAYNIYSEGTEQFVTGPVGGDVPVTADRGGASSWELFYITTNGGVSSIQANSNSKYFSVQSNGQILPNSATVGTNEQFYLVDASSISQDAPPPQNVPDGEQPSQSYDAGPDHDTSYDSAGSALSAWFLGSLFLVLGGAMM